MKVFIAEDDATSRKILEQMLMRWGYETVSVTNGEDALEGLRAEDAPNIAIRDWMMPGVDGPEVCRRLRALHKPKPLYIILLTALGQKDDIVSGLDAGADDYMVKPFAKEELHARLGAGRRIIELQTKLEERVRELKEAAYHIKTLQGLLPICMHCHKIRTDNESWQKLEAYIEDHSEAHFSHGLCPECLEIHYPEYPDDAEEKGAKPIVKNTPSP